MWRLNTSVVLTVLLWIQNISKTLIITIILYTGGATSSSMLTMNATVCLFCDSEYGDPLLPYYVDKVAALCHLVSKENLLNKKMCMRYVSYLSFSTPSLHPLSPSTTLSPPLFLLYREAANMSNNVMCCNKYYDKAAFTFLYVPALQCSSFTDI